MGFGDDECLSCGWEKHGGECRSCLYLKIKTDLDDAINLLNGIANKRWGDSPEKYIRHYLDENNIDWRKYGAAWGIQD